MKFTTVKNPINFTDAQLQQFQNLSKRILSVSSENVEAFIPAQALDGKTPVEDILFMQFITSSDDFNSVVDIVDEWILAFPQVFSFSVITREDADDKRAGVCFDLGTSY